MLWHFTQTNELRAINRGAVLAEIARDGAISRADLASRTGLTVAAISRISRELITAGIVSEANEDATSGGLGRRTRALQFAKDAASLIVMVISANKRAVGIANCRGELLAVTDMPELDLSNADQSIDLLCGEATALMAKLDIDETRVLGVSVVVAVNTNPANNEKISSPVLEWTNVAAKSHIQERLKRPVHIEARAVALLQSELWQRPVTDGRSVVLINNGWRYGSSVHVNGQLIESTQGRLGQLAHLAIPGHDAKCYCSQRGCLDAIASGEAIVLSLANQQLMHFPDTTSLNQRLSNAIAEADTNTAVAAVFYQAGQRLAEGLASVLSLFEPERILLAGGTCRQADFYSGVNEKLGPLLAYHDNCELIMCDITSLNAAVISGLDTFLLSDTQLINRLIRLRKSA